MRKKCLFAGFSALFCLVLAFPGYAAETKKSVGLGAGISNIYLTLELDLRIKRIPIEMTYKYYFAGNMPGGLETYLKIYAVEKKHIRWHILDPGIYFRMGTEPISVRDVTIDRGTDITFGTGVDIMPWKNLCISLSVRWFLPGFKSAYAAGEKAALDYAVENFKIEPGKTIEEIVYENGEAAFLVASRRTKDIYKQALTEPQVQITFTWYFF
jgi:hypothetical protein